jgi:hypothetical protein
MNPRNQKQKVVAGVVSGLGGIDKFNFNAIPDSVISVIVDSLVL